MKTAHEFATKPGDKLSLAWLDENFQGYENKVNELEDRLNNQGEAIADQGALILQLQDAIKKLQPKPAPAKGKKK